MRYIGYLTAISGGVTGGVLYIYTYMSRVIHTQSAVISEKLREQAEKARLADHAYRDARFKLPVRGI